MSEVLIKSIPIGDIVQNTGQIDGLPKNPRFIRDAKFEKLKESINQDPEMMALREVVVYPIAVGKRCRYVAVAGNMRLRALKELGWKDVECKVLPGETTVEQLKAYTIKDNGSFGVWDYDNLANEWEQVELDGVDIDVSGWEVAEQDFDTSNKEVDVDLFDEELTLKINLTEQEGKWVKDRLAEIDSSPEMALLIAMGWNDNYTELDEEDCR